MRANSDGVVRVGVSVPWARIFFSIVAISPAVGLLLAGSAQRWMDDDGFINLRIVRNMLHGAGPVFNIDERVEAGTSPLWLLVLVGLGALGLRLERAAVGAGIVLTVFGLLASQAGALRLRDDPASPTASENESETRAWFPAGAAIVAALPPMWDYASGGLETGLGIAWLGGSFCALVNASLRSERSSAFSCCAVAALLGIGPLVRPEFGLYSLAFLSILVGREVWSGRRAAWPRIAAIGLSAGALPVLYEIFRMGYYGAIVPNTALAKEAFSARWSQGGCYFRNFFGTYLMGWPLAAAAPFWVAKVFARARRRRWIALAIVVAPTVAAALHVLFLVGMGGDYMHGRLLLSPLFAALLPVMMVRVEMRAPLVGRMVLGGCAVALVAWVSLCAAKLRVGVENECDIGDERGWYARQAGVDRPVDLDDFRRHPFYDGAAKWLQRVRADCPTWPVSFGDVRGPGCRRVFLDDDSPPIAPAPASSEMARLLDPDVSAIVSAGAIGMLGYYLPAEVHVVDVHGLADPIAARIELNSRGRPGHEKRLPAAWLLARFAEPLAGEDASVTAARHALQCGALSSLVPALVAPMTFRLFFDNVAGAWDRSRLRIPADVFDAESRFCHSRPMLARTAGGDGGSLFRWRCPVGQSLYGIRGGFQPKDTAISSVRALCRGDDAETTGPSFGETAEPFEVSCSSDAVATALYGAADRLVRSVGLICAAAGRLQKTSPGGAEGGQTYALECPHRARIIGITGRSGALVDSIGVLCEPEP